MTTLPTEPVAARPYYAAAFLMDVSLSLTVMAFPWIATRQYHASPELVGDLSALMTGLYTLVALSAGVLSRKLTPRTRMLGAACGVFISYGAAAASHSLAQLAAALCISWLIMGFYWPALQAQLCAGCPAEEIQRRLTRFNLSWSTGILTGPAIAGYLYARAPSLPLAAAFVGVGAVAATVALGSRRAGAAALAAGEAEITAGPIIRTSALILAAAWCGHFASYFSLAIVRTFFPIYATHRGIPFRTQGYMMLELGMFQAGAFFAMNYARRWLTRPAAFFGGLTLVIGGMLLLTRPSVPLEVIALAVVGTGVGVTYVLSIFHSLHSDNGSRNAGIHEGIVGGSGVFGGIAGGFTAKHYGLSTPFYLSAAAALFFMLPVALFLVRARTSSCGKQ